MQTTIERPPTINPDLPIDLPPRFAVLPYLSLPQQRRLLAALRANSVGHDWGVCALGVALDGRITGYWDGEQSLAAPNGILVDFVNWWDSCTDHVPSCTRDQPAGHADKNGALMRVLEELAP